MEQLVVSFLMDHPNFTLIRIGFHWIGLFKTHINILIYNESFSENEKLCGIISLLLKETSNV